jgi:cadmium resistance protein CadD (predicted permease)
MTNQSIYVIILLSFCKQNDQNEITNPLIGQGIGLSIILLLSFCKQNDQNERAM